MKLSYHAPILFSLSLALFAAGCEPPDGTHDPGAPHDTFEEPASGEERLDPMTPVEQPDALDPHQPAPQSFEDPTQPGGLRPDEFETPPPTGLPAEPDGLSIDRFQEDQETELPEGEEGSPPTFDPGFDTFDPAPPQPADEDE